MPQKIDHFISDLSINGQVIAIKTEVVSGFKEVRYTLKSEQEMATITVALALYLMCQSVCEKLDLTVDALTLGLDDAPSDRAH